jgi:hypothetical protein
VGGWRGVKTFFSSYESLRCQVLLDGEVRELYYLMASPAGDGNETGTYGDNRFFWVCGMPICVKRRECFLIEPNCENLRELFNTKRASRQHDTSKKSLCIFALLFINTQQSTAVRFVQRPRQVVQDLPNARRKSATQPVNLQTIQRNLRDHVSVRREDYDQRTRHAITYMPFTLLDRPDSVSTTSCLSSLFHLRMLQSEWTIGPRGHRNLM